MAGIEPATSWFLVGFINHCATTETPKNQICIINAGFTIAPPKVYIFNQYILIKHNVCKVYGVGNRKINNLHSSTTTTKKKDEKTKKKKKKKIYTLWLQGAYVVKMIRPVNSYRNQPAIKYKAHSKMHTEEELAGE